MKQTLLIITALMLMLGCSKEERWKLTMKTYKFHQEQILTKKGVNILDLYLNGDKLYLKDIYTNKPYSGKVFALYKNGQKSWEGTLKDGKPNGLGTGWHKNGMKRYYGTTKDGKKNGRWTYWYENGQKKFEGTYKDDEVISSNPFISAKCWDQDGDECECSEWGPGCD